MLNDQADQDERSRWLWILAAILLLLLFVGLGWFWWSGSKSSASQAEKTTPTATMASASSPKPMDAPPTSYDVAFGYHQTTIATNEALTGAFAAWRATAERRCGGQCSCQTNVRIDVVGHADRRTGTPAFNRCIAWKRAMVVADALVGLGIPRCEVTAHFVGAADIAAPEQDEATAAKHRHASISIVSGEKLPSSSCTGICRSSLDAADAARCEAKLKEPPLLHLN